MWGRTSIIYGYMVSSVTETVVLSQPKLNEKPNCFEVLGVAVVVYVVLDVLLLLLLFILLFFVVVEVDVVV